MEIFRIVRDKANLKNELGTLVGIVVWLMFVIAIGFQELPWLRKIFVSET